MGTINLDINEGSGIRATGLMITRIYINEGSGIRATGNNIYAFDSPPKRLRGTKCPKIINIVSMDTEVG